MDPLHKAETALCSALCLNQRREEALVAKVLGIEVAAKKAKLKMEKKLQEVERAKKKEEKRRKKEQLALEVAERKLKTAEKKRELEEARVLKVQLRVAKRCIREGLDGKGSKASSSTDKARFVLYFCFVYVFFNLYFPEA